MNVVIEDLQKKLPKVPFITTIIQKVYSKKNTGKGTSHKGRIMALQFWRVTITSFLPNTAHFVFFVGSQGTSWELFSSSVSDRKKLPREKKCYLYVCTFISRSLKVQIFTNIYANETDKFSHSKAKWTHFFNNILINFNSYIKEIKKKLQCQLANYRWC